MRPGKNNNSGDSFSRPVILKGGVVCFAVPDLKISYREEPRNAQWLIYDIPKEL
jgi:hypothetical protein